MLGVCKKARVDLRNIIIGHVRLQPEIGKEMKVIETIVSPSDENNVNVSCHIRMSTRVTDMEPMDGPYLWKVNTESGRTYIVEVMGRS